MEDSTSSTNEKKRKRRNLGDELEKLHSRISAIQKACIDGLLQRLNKEDDREKEKKRIESEFEPLYRQIDDLKRMEGEILESGDNSFSEVFSKQIKELENRIDDLRAKAMLEKQLPDLESGSSGSAAAVSPPTLNSSLRSEQIRSMMRNQPWVRLNKLSLPPNFAAQQRMSRIQRKKAAAELARGLNLWPIIKKMKDRKKKTE